MRFSCPFVLASASPRRRTLLARLGVPCTIDPAHVDETLDPLARPENEAARLAMDKAAWVAARHPRSLVLGADTVVVVDDSVLGKPESAEEAHAMLRTLSGRTHLVHTGIALVHPPSGRSVRETETTRVTFAPISDAERTAYVQTGSPLDKAGAYGIQDDEGAWFISGIEGDFYNVVGLPLHRLYRVVQRDFRDLLATGS